MGAGLTLGSTAEAMLLQVLVHYSGLTQGHCRLQVVPQDPPLQKRAPMSNSGTEISVEFEDRVSGWGRRDGGAWGYSRWGLP